LFDTNVARRNPGEVGSAGKTSGYQFILGHEPHNVWMVPVGNSFTTVACAAADPRLGGTNQSLRKPNRGELLAYTFRPGKQVGVVDRAMRQRRVQGANRPPLSRYCVKWHVGFNVAPLA
jgi:hypothetical protein